MVERAKLDHSVFLVVVGLMAWAIPGGGHFMIRERRRAAIIFVTITLTFLIGLYVGSVGVVDPIGGRIWFFGQMLTSPLVGILGNISKTGEYAAFGKPADIGQIYTTVAGMLNLLCILSAVYMAYTGRGEMIGTEEENA